MSAAEVFDLLEQAAGRIGSGGLRVRRLGARRRGHGHRENVRTVPRAVRSASCYGPPHNFIEQVIR